MKGLKIQLAKNKLNQKEFLKLLNEKSNKDYSYSSLSNWANDRNNPELEIIILISDILNCTVDELVNPKNKMEAKK